MLNITPLERNFLPQDLVIQTWDDLRAYTDALETRVISTLEEFKHFLHDVNEFYCITAEESMRRYIATTVNTADQTAQKKYDDYLDLIEPNIKPFTDRINRKITGLGFLDSVTETGFKLALKSMQSKIELFQEKNIPIAIEAEKIANDVQKSVGELIVTLAGEELTIGQASDRLYELDREKREDAWIHIRHAYLSIKDKLDSSFDELVQFRHTIAVNAGFTNYRDYQFKNLKRYDYTPKDCMVFHDAIEKAVCPVVDSFAAQRKQKLGVEKLRPWDMFVDPQGRPPLKAFDSAADLIEKGKQAFAKTDPYFEAVLEAMIEKNLLDLASRKNKKPGAYMTTLDETMVPFIFGNSTQTVNDVSTFFHEMGHAVHGVAINDLPFWFQRDWPMEVAELGSMSMELLTLDQWSNYFSKEEDLNRAKKEHLEQIIAFFPWMAQVDAFQHQIYLEPELTSDQRHDIFMAGQKRFVGHRIDWSGFDHLRRVHWHRQMHIFSDPFYYIEYGIAQIGALQIWRNYRQDSKQALQQYKNALALGYTKSIPEIYETAGIKFDFSATMLTDLMTFVQKEMTALN